MVRKVTGRRVGKTTSRRKLFNINTRKSYATSRVSSKTPYQVARDGLHAPIHKKSTISYIDAAGKKLIQQPLEKQPEKTVRLKPTNKVPMQRRGPRPQSKAVALRPIEFINEPTHGKKIIPLEVEHTFKPSVIHAGGIPTKEVHKTYVKTGRKPSKAITLLKTLQGSTKRVTYDSKIDAKTIIRRNALDHQHGFNSVLNWVLPTEAIFTLGDITYENRIFPLYTNLSAPGSILYFQEKTDVDFYVSMLKVTTELQIFNQNTHFPSNYKISLIRLKSTSVSNAELFLADIHKNVYNLGNLPESNLRDNIPQTYFHKLTQYVPEDGVVAEVSPKAFGMSKSDHFSTYYEIVKTFTKKVGAQGSWNFKHDHTFGAGLHLNPLVSRMRNSETLNNPAIYFYFIEAYGVPTEGILRGESTGAGDPGGTSSYIGTSPGNFLTEIRTSVEYVNSDYVNTDSASGDIKKSAHVRMFVKDEVTNSSRSGEAAKVAYGTADLIVGSVADHIPGKWLIPVMADEVVTYNTSSTNGLQNTPN